MEIILVIFSLIATAIEIIVGFACLAIFVSTVGIFLYSLVLIFFGKREKAAELLK